MPKKRTSDDFSRWTRDSFIQYIDEKIQMGMKVSQCEKANYWQAKGSCMRCGCPKTDEKMILSPSPYICSLCYKKNHGQEAYDHVMGIMAPIMEDKVELKDYGKYADMILRHSHINPGERK